MDDVTFSPNVFAQLIKINAAQLKLEPGSNSAADFLHSCGDETSFLTQQNRK